MAKKTTRKYRQARAAAKSAAKAEFPGKIKAVRRDPMAKVSAEDRQVFGEIKKETKGGYITDDRGNKIYSKPTETARERIERERKEALRKFREQAAAEDGPQKPAKKATKKIKVTDKRSAAEKAASKEAAFKEVKKNTKKFVAKGSPKVVDTPVTKGGELEKKLKAEKKMTRAERSAANKAAWKNMSEAERKNWSANKPTAAAKPAAPAKPAAKAIKPAKTFGEISKTVTGSTAKRPTLASLKKNEAAELKRAAERVAAKKAAAPTLAAKNKALANSAKGKTQTPQAVEAKKKAAAKPEGKAAVKKPTAPKKFARTRALGKASAATAVAAEVVSLAKGSTAKDAREINRLRDKLAKATGKKSPGALARFKEGVGSEVGQLAALTSLGYVGKTRRQRMDELNAKIAKAEKKNKPKELRYGKDGSSLVPGTAAYKAGSKTKPTVASTTGGGSTSKVDTRYTVKKGDTLSGIAKTANVSLSDLKAANPYIMKKKKYKQGSMIWSGTKVNIPKK